MRWSQKFAAQMSDLSEMEIAFLFYSQMQSN